ncbi:HlyD family efflux transporter periplasmic adaptor subunit [Pseudonocardia pini]|uniref:HlyD family efflux transporter periplasmic adaptor subunit n=1 Tax=Pseudonocardia pini TaxID=2758030 RepID=UPI0015F09ED5|nr:biotin/lipoyl-binding protein [Pseudonocardia pini]
MGTVALVGAVLAGCSGSDTPPAPTAVVDRGTVSQGVSASGSLVSITQQNLGFAEGGRLVELSVKVGDVVAAGQPLARLDDGAARSQLASAQAKLNQQDASLGKLTGDNSVASAEAALDSARAVLDATRSQVDATSDANESAVSRAQVQLDFDHGQQDAAEDQLAEDRRDCPDGEASATAAGTTSTTGDTTGSGTATDTGTTTTSGSDPACSALAADEQNVTTAKRQVIASQTALDQARSKQSTDAAAGRLSIVNAEKSISDAQSQLDGARTSGPADVAVQSAVVADAPIGEPTR